MKHRYRHEDGEHLAVIEDDERKRVSTRVCATREEAQALVGQASLIGATSFDEIEAAPATKPKRARKPKAAATTKPGKKKGK